MLSPEWAQCYAGKADALRTEGHAGSIEKRHDLPHRYEQNYCLRELRWPGEHRPRRRISVTSGVDSSAGFAQFHSTTRERHLQQTDSRIGKVTQPRVHIGGRILDNGHSASL